MSDSAYTILIAEDDDSIRHALTDVLTASGYEVLALEEGLAAIHAVRERNFDLALLDVAMPGADGFQVLQAMSEERPGTPVIMLTARGEEEDRVQGLKLGADDYISKPFGVLELTARVNVALRKQAVSDVLVCGNISLDEKSMSVSIDGRTVELNNKEFHLLRFLMRNEGRALSRDAILDAVWGYDEGETRTVDVHIKRLREKVENVSDQWALKTVWGVGYKFELTGPRQS